MKSFYLAATLGVSALAITGAAQAQSSLEGGDITFIVPWAPGGGSDAIARSLAPGLEEALGANVIIQNMPGAGGVLGWRNLANAEPDGRTFSIVTTSILMINHINAEQAVDFRDYEFISHVADSPLVLMTAPDSAYESLEDILDAAADDPGEVLLATAGIGTMWHIGGLGLGVNADVEFDFIPYSGGGEAIPAIMGNQVDGGAGTLTEAASYLVGGQMRPLAVFAEERSTLLPDVPTLMESGVDYVFNAWWGLLAPQSTPQDVLDELHEAVLHAVNTERFQAYAENTALTIVGNDGATLEALAEAEDSVIAELLAQADLN